MAFVYEYISDEDKQRIDFSKIRVGGDSADPYRWVIDREVNAFLIWVSLSREPPPWEWYAFWWQNKVYPVAVLEQQSIRTQDGKYIVPVKIGGHMLTNTSAELTIEMHALKSKIEDAVKVELRGNALKAGWGHDISEVRIEYIEKGAVE